MPCKRRQSAQLRLTLVYWGGDPMAVALWAEVPVTTLAAALSVANPEAPRRFGCAPAPYSTTQRLAALLPASWFSWETLPNHPFVVYNVKETRKNGSTIDDNTAYCFTCSSSGTFETYSGSVRPCSEFHEYAQTQWDYGYKDPVETRNFQCLPQWPSYICPGN